MKHKTQRGYTIVELMVTVAIFSLGFTVIGAIFLGFSTAQSRASTSIRLLNEGVFLFESIAREVRMNAIDYDCGLHSTSYICLKSVDVGGEIHFRRTGSAGSYQLESCTEFNGSTCVTWNSLVPNFLIVTNFEFHVYPKVNPLTASSFNEVYHPMTLLRMSMEAGGGRTIQRYDLQTTVSSRAYDF